MNDALPGTAVHPRDTVIGFRQRWVRESRYYETLVHQDLWGGWVLTRIWGQRGSRLGRVKHLPCDDFAAAEAEMKTIETRRRQHGYTRVPTPTPQIRSEDSTDGR